MILGAVAPSHLVHHDAPQRTPEWFAARLGRVTASNAAAVLAKGKGKDEAVTRRDYRLQLVVERLTGQSAEDSYTNAAMEHGVAHEAAARDLFAATTGLMVVESGFWADRDTMIGTSLDGYISRGTTLLADVVEIKCPFKTAHHLTTLRDRTVPSQYLPQLTHQVYVTGADGAYFVSYDPRLPERLQLAHLYVPRTALPVTEYEAALLPFLAEVEADVKAWSVFGGESDAV